MAAMSPRDGSEHRADSVGKAACFARDPSSSIGSWRNVAITFGREAPSLEAMKNYHLNVENVLKEYPAGVGLVTVMREKSTPAGDGRDVAIKMFRELGPRLTAALFVVTASGFAAAIQRSVISAVILASGQKGHFKVVPALEDGLDWFAERVGPTEGAGQFKVQLGTVIREFCETEREYLGAVLRSGDAR
jgi:hypothetical protein